MERDTRRWSANLEESMCLISLDVIERGNSRLDSIHDEMAELCYRNHDLSSSDTVKCKGIELHIVLTSSFSLWLGVLQMNCHLFLRVALKKDLRMLFSRSFLPC